MSLEGGRAGGEGREGGTERGRYGEGEGERREGREAGEG